MTDQIVEVSVSNLEVLKDLVMEVNELHKTDFELIDSVDKDGVEFARIKTGGSDLNMIYLLGVYHGMRIQAHKQTSTQLIK